MATTTHDVLEAIAGAAESVVDGLAESKKILDPKTSPATRLHKLFSVDMQDRNTGKHRDRADRQMRLESLATLRVAWRLNPKDEALTQRLALKDEQNVIRALLTDLRPPLDQCRTLYRSTRRQVNKTREWFFADILMSIEFDRSITTDVAY